MYIFVNTFVIQRNNPYASTQWFDRSLVKVKMYEVLPASYDEQVTKPLIQFRGIGIYGREGLYFGNLYPVNRDFFVRAEQGFYHFYYKSGGQRTIVPILLSMFYSDEVKKFQPPEPIVATGHEKEAMAEAVSKAGVAGIGEEAKQAFPRESPSKHGNLGFLLPAVEQLELMTDNFLDNFMTRQQSIAMQSMDTLDVLTRVVVPTGLIVIAAIVVITTALTFSGDVVNHAVSTAAAVKVDCVAKAAPAVVNATQAAPANSGSEVAGIFEGLLPKP